MQRAADQFVGTHDFRAVRSVGTETRTTVRTVYYFDVSRTGDLIECRVCANGFLYNMGAGHGGDHRIRGRGEAGSGGHPGDPGLREPDPGGAHSSAGRAVYDQAVV